MSSEGDVPRCSVCEAKLPTEPEEDCDGLMELCKNVCPRLHIEDFRDGLTFCTSCFVWLLGTYNDILAGRDFDPRAVRYLHLMVVDQGPLQTERVKPATKKRRSPLADGDGIAASRVSSRVEDYFDTLIYAEVSRTRHGIPAP